MDQSLDWSNLAGIAAQILVKGVAGGAAQALRARLVRLFTRGAADQVDQSPEIRRLEETDRRLEQADDHAAEEQSQLVSWKRRLEVFIEDHPEAVEELSQIVDEYRQAYPEQPGSGVSQVAKASGGAVVIQAGRDNSGGVTR